MSIDQRCLAATYDLKINVIDLSSLEIYQQYEVNNSQVNRICVDNTRFYAATYSNLIAFDLKNADKKPIITLPAHDSNVIDIAISPQTLFTCGEDKLIKCWDRRSITVENTFTLSDPVNAIALSPDGSCLFSGTESGELTFWDLRNGNVVMKIIDRKSPIRSLSMHPTNQTLLVGYMDGTAIQFQVTENTLKQNFELNCNNEILLRCVTSPDGNLLATAGGENLVKIWTANTGNLLKSIQCGDKTEWIWDAAFTKDSHNLVTGCSNGEIKVLECTTGNSICQIPQLPKCISAIGLIS